MLNLMLQPYDSPTSHLGLAHKTAAHAAQKLHLTQEIQREDNTSARPQGQKMCPVFNSSLSHVHKTHGSSLNEVLSICRQRS